MNYDILSFVSRGPIFLSGEMVSTLVNSSSAYARKDEAWTVFPPWNQQLKQQQKEFS